MPRRAQDQKTVFEARAYLEGLRNMLRNMEDEPIEFLQPFELLLLLDPIAERLDRLRQDP